MRIVAMSKSDIGRHAAAAALFAIQPNVREKEFVGFLEGLPTSSNLPWSRLPTQSMSSAIKPSDLVR